MHLMEREVSLPLSEVLTACVYPEPDESTRLSNIFLQD